MSNTLIKSKAKNKYNLRLLTSIIIFTIILVFSTIYIKNLIISEKCKDSLYSIDYYLTHYKDKKLRLIKVDSILVVEQQKNSFTIEAVGMQSVEPYKEITVIGSFHRNNDGKWDLLSVNTKPANKTLTSEPTK